MEKISVSINGKLTQVNAECTVQEILNVNNVKNPMVLVERNKEIVPKENFNRRVTDGDVIEILGFFGGG